jgi:hypothetical protein
VQRPNSQFSGFNLDLLQYSATNSAAARFWSDEELIYEGIESTEFDAVPFAKGDIATRLRTIEDYPDSTQLFNAAKSLDRANSRFNC